MKGVFGENYAKDFVGLSHHADDAYEASEEENGAPNSWRAKLRARVFVGMKSAGRKLTCAAGNISRAGTSIKKKIKKCTGIISVQYADSVELYDEDISEMESLEIDDLLVPEMETEKTETQALVRKEPGQMAQEDCSHVYTSINDDVPAVSPRTDKRVMCKLEEGIHDDKESSSVVGELEELNATLIDTPRILPADTKNGYMVAKNLGGIAVNHYSCEDLQEAESVTKVKDFENCGPKKEQLTGDILEEFTATVVGETRAKSETVTRSGSDSPLMLQEEEGSCLSFDEHPSGILQAKMAGIPDNDVESFVNSLIEEVLGSIEPVQEQGFLSSSDVFDSFCSMECQTVVSAVEELVIAQDDIVAIETHSRVSGIVAEIIESVGNIIDFPESPSTVGCPTEIFPAQEKGETLGENCSSSNSENSEENETVCEETCVVDDGKINSKLGGDWVDVYVSAICDETTKNDVNETFPLEPSHLHHSCVEKAHFYSSTLEELSRSQCTEGKDGDGKDLFLAHDEKTEISSITSAENINMPPTTDQTGTADAQSMYQKRMCSSDSGSSMEIKSSMEDKLDRLELEVVPCTKYAEKLNFGESLHTMGNILRTVFERVSNFRALLEFVVFAFLLRNNAEQVL
ncbi:hypothetical protein FGB62_35g115 [Gracilaria domingensis]|nr:hypothetical protein FGB62_35g115 [Gracilaria domingensis]